MIGTADLSRPPWHPGGPQRKVVVLVPFRRWADFLALGVTEIREYGSSSIQVMRRVRAMLEKLSLSQQVHVRPEKVHVRPENRPVRPENRPVRPESWRQRIGFGPRLDFDPYG